MLKSLDGHTNEKLDREDQGTLLIMIIGLSLKGLREKERYKVGPDKPSSTRRGCFMQFNKNLVSLFGKLIY